MKPAIRLEGIEESKRVLKTLEYKARRRVVTAAARAGGREILKNARSYAPTRTGQLRKQLRQSVNNNRATGTVTATIKPKRTKAQRRKGAQLRSNVIHLVVGGTRPHVIPGPISFAGRIFSQVDHPGARANPFMDRAANKSFQPAIAAFQREFGRKMDQEIQRAKT